MKAEPVRKRLIYFGRVQGVGFRATVYEIASRFPVTGFVKNLPDGTVEMVIDGRVDVVGEVLENVENRFSGNISRVEGTAIARDGDFVDFEIRR